MVAEPPPTPVTSPFPLTVATATLLLLHVIFLLVAFSGNTLAAITPVSPKISEIEVGLSEIPVTATEAEVTVIVQVAVNPPSSVVAVTTAVPAATAVTTPVWLTVATASLLLLHAIFLFVALAGATIAVSCAVFPSTIPSVVLLRETPVTGTTASVTVTTQVAVNPPSSVVAVITVFPGETAVTTPVESTVATSV